MKSITLPTSDGISLSATLFESVQSSNKFLLINSATGVKQQLYFGFARYFAENGFTVITYDYRGIGESKPQKLQGFEASMRIWGAIDYKTVTDFIAENYPNHQKFLLGHSVGALILGMNEDTKMFEKLVFTATQDAYFGNLNFKVAVFGLLGFGALLPVITSVLGYFPSQWFGLGESLPKGVAYDWRTLIMHPKSTGKLLAKSLEDHSDDLTQEAFIIHAEDDDWVTEKGMESLLNKVYPNLKKKYREVKVAESAQKEIGHINFFRSYNRNLWEIVLKELV